MKNTVLLLTACVNPGGMKFTVLQDKEARKKQYIKAVKFYLENTSYRIVFCENSGEDLTDLTDLAVNHGLEILSFQGNDYDKSLGKGFGEYGIVQYAFQNSKYIKEATTVVKVTGRLIVNNLVEVISLQNKLFLFPKRFVYVGDSGHNSYDSRCIVANKEFFSTFFLTSSNPINDSSGYYFEHYLFDIINQLSARYIVSDFVFPLAFSGMSGSTGVEYEYEEMNKGKKLSLLRDFCQYKKRFYKKTNKFLFVWFSIFSSIIRVIKHTYSYKYYA